MFGFELKFVSVTAVTSSPSLPSLVITLHYLFAVHNFKHILFKYWSRSRLNDGEMIELYYTQEIYITNRENRTVFIKILEVKEVS
jgi:hypothetical protein